MNRGPRFTHDVKLRCLKCDGTRIDPVGPITNAGGYPGVHVRCADCGCLWRTRSAALVREIELGRRKAVA